jgi:hypothetical protein
MKLGDMVRCTMVDRALTFTGKPWQFDPPLTIEGPVVARSEFLFERVCGSFTHEGEEYTVWKETQSGEVQAI